MEALTLQKLVGLFLRDAAMHPNLTDETKCSIGWWSLAPGDDHPSFNARLAVPLGDLRRAAETRDQESTAVMYGETSGMQRHIILCIGDEKLKIVWLTPLWVQMAAWVNAIEGLRSLA